MEKAPNPEELLPSRDKPLRGTLRLPTEADPFQGEERMPPQNMKAVLQKKLEEKERELAEQKKSGVLGASSSVPSQKVPPPSLPLKRPPSATISSQDKSASKRVKALATKASGTGGGLSRVREKEKESKGEKERGKGAASDLNVPWIPNFVTPGKKQIFKSDSLQKDPSLAFTLQSGLMLARDITAPQSLKAALNDYYFFAGRVSRSFICSFPLCSLPLPSDNGFIKSYSGNTINHGCAMLPDRA